jgi:predicted ATP-dependent Lon-type protease
MSSTNTRPIVGSTGGDQKPVGVTLGIGLTYPSPELALIKLALDAGAKEVVVPMVTTRAEA